MCFKSIDIIEVMKKDYAYNFIRFFVNILTNFLFREIEIIGEENIPMEGPIILATNHNS
jgi:glycerol-3-phosphate O-acyltransferase/dihydroxyacetone phosphate acyltransferase